jgi:alkylation response protein AidB-like acyl-CoA dehydrogenase
MSIRQTLPPRTAPRSFAAASGLDRFLGDPDDLESPMPRAATLADDRAAAFPGGAIEALNSWGVQRHYIPRARGGELDDVLAPLLLMRNVARRDVTAAVAHGKTVLGAMCAWAADDDSATRMAAIVDGGDPVSWGLTEQGRGSDIGSSATTAVAEGAGVVLDGHKWPIGNATRGRAITVLARTDDRGGPRSLSLFLVDKTAVDARTIAYRARRPLHGIRGADISGIEFSATRVSPDSAVGSAGHGLELVLKSLQVTRTLCTALSLGAGDQAISLVLSRAEGRRALGTDSVEREVARGSVADLLIAEAGAFAGARQISTAPDELALVSAFVKVLAPDAVERIFRELSAALGERSQLVTGRPWEQFQKASRDNRVVGIFDGNSVVNLNVVINELPNISREGEVDVAALVADLRFASAPDVWDISRLRLITRRGSSILRALPALVERAADDGTHPDAVASARLLLADAESTLAAAAAAERVPRPPVGQFAIAERLTLLFAAAACLGVHVANRAAPPGPLWDDDLWIRSTLARLAARAGLQGGPVVPDELFDAAVDAVDRRIPVSILPEWWSPVGGAA